MFQLPIRMVLGDGLAEGRGMTVIYEMEDGSAGRHTVKYVNPEFSLVRFTDGPSVIVFEERRAGMFGGKREFLIRGIYINRNIQHQAY